MFAGESKVEDVNGALDAAQLTGDGLLLRKGKKKFMRLVLK